MAEFCDEMYAIGFSKSESRVLKESPKDEAPLANARRFSVLVRVGDH